MLYSSPNIQQLVLRNNYEPERTVLKLVNINMSDPCENIGKVKLKPPNRLKTEPCKKIAICHSRECTMSVIR